MVVTRDYNIPLEFRGGWKGGWGVEDISYNSGEFGMSIEIDGNKRPVPFSGAFKGRTEDKHGIADINGELIRNHIIFLKRYTNGKEAKGFNALTEGIVYQGVRVSDFGFRGLWCLERARSRDDLNLHYEFTLSVEDSYKDAFKELLEKLSPY